jgi:putative transposase
MRPGFLPGDELIEPSSGTVLYVVEYAVPLIQSIKVLDKPNRTEVLLDEEELRQQIVSDQIRVRRHREVLGGRQKKRSLQEDALMLATKRLLATLNSLRRRLDVSFNKAYDTLKKDHDAGRTTDITFLPSRGHAFKLWQRNREGLLTHKGNAAKGNRSPRHSAAVLEVVKASAAHYLQIQSKWTLRSLTEYVNTQLNGTRVSQQYVRRVIHEQLHADPDHARMLVKDAIGAKAVASRKIQIEGLLERTEQDALHLPFVVTTRYGISNEVYLVHAIDCCTGIPLGWHLVIGPPRTSSTLACIESILFPKAPRFAALGLAYDLDVYGPPEQIWADNGPENKSVRLPRLSRVGIDFHRLKGNHPHHKPFIERLNGALKVRLETLPGCTRFNGKDGKRDPVALGDSIMPLEELEKWIVRFYFEDWVNRPLKRLEDSIFKDDESLGFTPKSRFRALTEVRLRAMPLPISVDEWRSVVFDWQELTLSRKSGISYEGFQFRGDRLPGLINEFGETKVTVLIDDDDFRTVSVMGRDGQTLIPLVNAVVDSTSVAYTFAEARKKREELRAAGKDPDCEKLLRDIFSRSVGAPAPPTPSPKSQTKPAKRSAASKQTTQLSREHDALLRSVKSPLPMPEPRLGNPPLGNVDDPWSSTAGYQVSNRKKDANEFSS